MGDDSSWDGPYVDYEEGSYSAHCKAKEARQKAYDDARRQPICFPHSSLVETPWGRVPIGDLSEGERVLSYSRGILVPRLITRKLVHGEAPLIQINFDAEGKSLLCTVSHSFLTNRGWLEAKKIRSGDIIVRINTLVPEQSRVTSIIATGKKEPVFNLYTQGEHNFIVDGCVAHNFTYFRVLRTVLHRLLFDGLVEVASEQQKGQHFA